MDGTLTGMESTNPADARENSCPRPGRAWRIGWETAGVLVLILVGAASIFWNSGGHIDTHLAGGADTWLGLHWMRWHVDSVCQGRSWSELWQMPNLYPEAYMTATTDHMIGNAVLFAPFYLLLGRPILAFNLWIFLLLTLNFLSAYLVARRLLRAPVPALLVGALFAFNFVRLVHIAHWHLWPHFPTPLLFLAAVRMSERSSWRWPIGAGLCLAAQFYMSMYLGYMAALMAGIMLVTLACRVPARFLQRGFLVRLAVAALAGGVPLLPLAVPYRWTAQRWGYWEWHEAKTWIPTWNSFFAVGTEFEKVSYLGHIYVVLLSLGTCYVVWQLARRREEISSWVVACVVLIAVLACVLVNQFSTYHTLYKFLPGFAALRCPGRLALLISWPAGLLCGWVLLRLGQTLSWMAPGLKTALGLGLVVAVVAENGYRPIWQDATLPEAELYRTTVRQLPEGAIADVPLIPPVANADVPVAMMERVTAAVVAGWRPTLSAYTGKMPAWFAGLWHQERRVSQSEEAATLLGELRLRGLRYVLLHKRQMSAEHLKCWLTARTSDGGTWGQVVYDDEQLLILDLAEAPLEARLCPAPAAGESVTVHSPTLALRPCMPLRPGTYRAAFDIETGADSAGYYEVQRVNPLPKRAGGAPVQAALPTGPGRRQVALEFVVPNEVGPEPILEFHLLPTAGTLPCLHSVTITPAGEAHLASRER